MKTSDLKGAELDRWVAKGCRIPGHVDTIINTPEMIEANFVRTDEGKVFSPSRTWADGGPILERERISVGSTGTLNGQVQWFAQLGDHAHGSGTTYLEAAMRAFVMSKFGNEVSDT